MIQYYWKQDIFDANTASTKFQMLDETFDTPIMTAALSHMHRAYENGMVELAKGARDAGAVYWTGMGDMAELDAIVDSPGYCCVSSSWDHGLFCATPFLSFRIL